MRVFAVVNMLIHIFPTENKARVVWNELEDMEEEGEKKHQKYLWQHLKIFNRVKPYINRSFHTSRWKIAISLSVISGNATPNLSEYITPNTREQAKNTSE
jgi:hypothetical protein